MLTPEAATNLRGQSLTFTLDEIKFVGTVTAAVRELAHSGAGQVHLS